MNYLLNADAPLELFRQQGGGKAANLARLARMEAPVPEWFCLSSEAFSAFIAEHNLHSHLHPEGDLQAFANHIDVLFSSLPLPATLQQELDEELKKRHLQDAFVAVRSSGLDEDSPEFSFAGQFSSFLFQKGKEAILRSIKRCWASGFSERGLSYRIRNNLPLDDIRVGVVIQRMVDSEVSGVAFSRNPVDPLDRSHVMISSVWGLGEGLVSGELDADHFLVDRDTLESETHPVKKTEALRQGPEGGLIKCALPKEMQEIPSLNPDQIQQVAKLVIDLENHLGTPQDCEWGIAQGKLFCFQTRPITTLPPNAFFDPEINGTQATLWDNSNIIESYSGVTSPLTFTFASNAYRQVYIQFCQVIGISDALIQSYQSVFRNMLGLIRGRVYYNLINWYKLVVLLPGAANNKSFMETMMGVRQGLSPEVASLFDFAGKPPKFSLWHHLKLLTLTSYRFLKIDSIVKEFHLHFDRIYDEARHMDFNKLSLPDLADYYHYLDEQILHRWQAPIINDCLCMVFFGLLKKLTEKWIAEGNAASSLQNDLLCGQGDLESTEPTKMLMRIAEKIDKGDPSFRQWFLDTSPDDISVAVTKKQLPGWVANDIAEFLDHYGFRCVNELKLEENDLHDDPSFAINAIASYVRMRSYSIKEMESREKAILTNAESIVSQKLTGWRKAIFFWVLKQTRRAIRYRENLRFARTKIFGVIRHLFRAMGGHLTDLGAIGEQNDVFYLTLDELFAFIEGRSPSSLPASIVDIRKKEFDSYRRSPPPPDRFVTYGAAGASMRYPQVLASADTMRSSTSVSSDPSLLTGTPCCPGIVEGVVRVVSDLKDAMGINGEILVTERTDPGWVPLYPSCSGLLIERGSLLSHSAVVARELGLPTIVGISGGLMQKLKTGMRVHVDASKGEIKILE